MSYGRRNQSVSEWAHGQAVLLTIGIIWGLFNDGLWGAFGVVALYFSLMGICMLIGGACALLTWILGKVTL